MKKTTSYILGIMLSSLALSLPAEAAIPQEDSYAAAAAAQFCSQTADLDRQADTANRSCELAMDTEDAILTGILGAAVIGAAIAAGNEHHHRETVIVEQAPPPPPPAQTIIVHETSPHGPGYHPGHHGTRHVRHHDQRRIGSRTPAPPKHKAYENRHGAGHDSKRHVSCHAPASPQHKAHGSRQSRGSKAHR